MSEAIKLSNRGLSEIEYMYIMYVICMYVHNKDNVCNSFFIVEYFVVVIIISPQMTMRSRWRTSLMSRRKSPNSNCISVHELCIRFIMEIVVFDCNSVTCFHCTDD